jgi:glycine/D-amino acid oxidase-like deaminating enzyme
MIDTFAGTDGGNVPVQMLWRGLQAFQEATALLEAAQAAAAATTAGQAPGIRQPFVWRHGMLRASRSAKQARDVARFLPVDLQAAAATGAEVLLDAAAMAALVPGLQPKQLLPLDQQQQLAGESPPPPAAVVQPPRQRQQAAAVHPPAAGLLVRGGVTLHPGSYIQALWAACQLAAARAGPGSEATLHLRAVPSLRELTDAEGQFDAVVVAAGAAVESIAELRGLLPLDLCHGHSLEMRPGGTSSSSSSSDDIGSRGSSSDNIGSSSSSDNSSSSNSSDGSSNSSRSGDSAAGGLKGYPAGAPSLLGSPYIAAHGSHSAVVGATKRYGLTAAEAYRQCSSPLVTDAAEAEAAAEALLPAARVLWPPLAGWQVASVRAGVRAIPARGAAGSIPYAGKLPTQQHLPSCWVIGGLGARGLVYHAWLGKLVAAAVSSGSESGLPPELLRWKSSDVV